MIKSRADFEMYMSRDMQLYYRMPYRERFICRLIRDPLYMIARYVRYLRKEEYFYNCGCGRIGTIMYLWYFRKKNILGNKLGLKIPKNTMGPGLTIYHHGEIIVNEAARVGENCRLHGGNCIGNNGKNDIPPVIGNGLDMGFGASIIGPVVLGDNITVGANAVVVKSFEESNITLAGVPARRI